MKTPLRSAERSSLLFLLAIAAGSADGWSYFGLGHAFVANMTGNTVLLGIAVFAKNGDIFHPLISLACYAAGVVIASLTTGKVQPGALWARAISWTLLLEGLLLGGAEAGWIAVHRTDSAPDHNVLLGVVALAVGMQSAAMLPLKVPAVVTTYISGTWTNLINGLTRFERDTPSNPKDKLPMEERLLLQAGILAVYFFSAVLTGWLFRYYPAAVGAVSAGAVLMVATYTLIRLPEDSQPPVN
jgi:uncharacterized membrane protein YoaK (UPF0700 family)